MKLDNKGFVVSTLMYTLLIVFLFLIIGIITLLSNRKMILDKLKKDVKNELNGMTKYDYYPNGTAVYYNPVTNKICSDYEEDNSLNENKTGCMKWYTFNDSVNSNKVNMILDHNTTYKVAYNSEGTNSEPKEAKEELDKLVDEFKWKVTPRLITADEIAHIVGADRDDTIKWSSGKPYGTTIDTQSGWYYFDGSGTTYSTSNGWQKNVVNSTNKSKYVWLYDYTKNCVNSGCNNQDSNTNGYWTNSAVVNSSNLWYVYAGGIDGHSNYGGANNINYFGVRPVITVDKKVLSTSFSESFEYTGDVQTFMPPVPGNYKIELWGAQGGSYDNTNNKLGGYTSGNIIILENNIMYIYVGEQGTKTNLSKNSGTYNGGGINYFPDDVGVGASGGGATDIRLVGGNWDNFNSLKSRIMVAAGAGGKGYAHVSSSGGAAGGLNGYDATKYDNDNWIKKVQYGLGGTQTSPGDWDYENANANGACNYSKLEKGGFGYGGSSVGCYDGGGSGGSGYYGGAGGVVQSGAGGSSFISGHNGCDAIDKSSTSDNIKHTGQSIHYSGLKFTDTVMIDGAGCKWTTEITSDCSGMPTHDGKSTMTGNTGNGYAKITYLGK